MTHLQAFVGVHPAAIWIMAVVGIIFLRMFMRRFLRFGGRPTLA